jgi:AcrR family transcriptional regulator
MQSHINLSSADRGLDGLTMEGVAQGAGVPIGSLYQFFPDRNALLARLFSQILEATDGLVQDRFREVDSAASFEAAAEGLVESLYQEIAGDPALVEIWTAVQASRALRHLDTEDSRRNANVLYEAARSFAPNTVSEERLLRACFLVCDLLRSVQQTALEQGGRDGELLVQEYTEMARCYMSSVFGG